jgi:photosystem II stability/assembly factor-like uncharacterized protein
VRLANLALASLVAVSACADKQKAPGAAPTNVAVTPGDGVALMTWEPLPELVYWIFYRPGNAVNAAEIGSIAIKNAVSPRAVIGLLNDTQYAFVMNATQQDSAAGPSSPVVTTTTRLAGSFWTVGGTPIAPNNLNAIAFNTVSRYVAVGDGTTILAGDFNYASQNPLGVTQWAPPNPLQAPFSDDLKAVIYNGSFVVLGSNGSVASSLDGVNWTVQHPVQSAGVSGLNGLVFGFTPTSGSTYIAVGNGGQMYTSTDLTQQWTPNTSANTTNDLTSISVLNGFLVATGANNTLLVSPDGVTWTQQATGLPQGTTLRAATFMPNVLTGTAAYVVVGDGGAIVSTTAILKDSTGTIATGTWTPTLLPDGQNLRSVTVGGATGLRFLAVGQGGSVAFSDDGASWSTVFSGADLSSVHFFSGQYLAVGSGGVGAVSH